MHQTVFVARVVPEQHASFLLLSAGDSFFLEVGACFAVEFVSDCDARGLVEGHQTG